MHSYLAFSNRETNRAYLGEAICHPKPLWSALPNWYLVLMYNLKNSMCCFFKQQCELCSSFVFTKVFQGMLQQTMSNVFISNFIIMCDVTFLNKTVTLTAGRYFKGDKVQLSSQRRKFINKIIDLGRTSKKNNVAQFW